VLWWDFISSFLFGWLCVQQEWFSFFHFCWCRYGKFFIMFLDIVFTFSCISFYILFPISGSIRLEFTGNIFNAVNVVITLICILRFWPSLPKSYFFNTIMII
jgi:hypothetical protein